MRRETLQWRCDQCGAANGPEVVYCPECGEAGPEVREPADKIPPGPLPPGLILPFDAGSDSSAVTRVQSGAGSRSTLVGTSAGIAPSLLGTGADEALMQPLPRRVRINLAGWTALVGGWPELCICAGTVPLAAIGIFASTRALLGLGSALLLAGGVGLSLVLAFLYGASDTTQTIRGYRLAKYGWAAGGEIARKFSRRGRLGSSHFVEYTYLDAQGVRRHTSQEASYDQWRGINVHDPVTVLYNPRRPTEAAIYELLGVIAVDTRPAALPPPAPPNPEDRDGDFNGNAGDDRAKAATSNPPIDADHGTADHGTADFGTGDHPIASEAADPASARPAGPDPAESSSTGPASTESASTESASTGPISTGG
jgi:hypothetical protein